MAYTPKTIHSGNSSGGYSTKNAQDLATVLEGLDTAVAAAGDVTPTASTLTDSTGGTANTTLVAISGSGDDADINNNFADLAAQVNALIVDVAALIATLA